MKKKNFTMFGNELFDDISKHDISSNELLVLMVLLRYSNGGKDTCYPPVSTIADKARVSQSSVNRAMKNLITKGYVEKLSVGNNLTGKANKYKIAILGVPASIPASKQDDASDISQDSRTVLTTLPTTLAGLEQDSITITQDASSVRAGPSRREIVSSVMPAKHIENSVAAIDVDEIPTGDSDISEVHAYCYKHDPNVKRHEDTLDKFETEITRLARLSGRNIPDTLQQAIDSATRFRDSAAAKAR